MSIVATWLVKFLGDATMLIITREVVYKEGCIGTFSYVLRLGI